MHSDIAKAIELIDQRIAALQNIRTQLAREFGGDEAERSVARPVSLSPSTFQQSSPPRSNGRGHLNRKGQVAEFIRTHGSASRSEIVRGTGIPMGTVSYCLNDENLFVNRNGRWHVVENTQ